jgi:hypothetical protein
MALWIGSPVAAVPDERGFALVGNADGGDIGGVDPGFFDHSAGGSGGGGPQVRRVMFNPARGGVVLGEIPLAPWPRPAGCHQTEWSGMRWCPDQWPEYGSWKRWSVFAMSHVGKFLELLFFNGLMFPF